MHETMLLSTPKTIQRRRRLGNDEENNIMANGQS
jgi:hypothetical protein